MSSPERAAAFPSAPRCRGLGRPGLLRGRGHAELVRAEGSAEPAPLLRGCLVGMLPLDLPGYEQPCPSWGLLPAQGFEGLPFCGVSPPLNSFGLILFKSVEDKLNKTSSVV